MIYFDHNATTPVAPEVLEAMLPYLREEWGNPSSSYTFGSKLRGVVESARERVGALIGARSREVLFTSCGTESNNAAVLSALKAKPEKREIVTSAVEHSSVLNHCRALEKEGYSVRYLPVDRSGLLKVADVEAALTEHTALVSLMWANNETGVLFPIREIAAVCRSHGVLFHCDGVQAIGKVKVDVESLGVDYLSLTGHKLQAPKGIGVLYVNRRAPFSPLLYGGHQERGRRGGTESVALIVGLGLAAEMALGAFAGYEVTVRPIRDSLERGILEGVAGTELNGDPDFRLANTSNITFRGVDSEALLVLLDQEGICASSGSACLADSDEPSHVVRAMKPDTGASREMVRFSIATRNTAAEARHVVEIINRLVCTLRGARL